MQRRLGHIILSMCDFFYVRSNIHRYYNNNYQAYLITTKISHILVIKKFNNYEYV